MRRKLTKDNGISAVYGGAILGGGGGGHIEEGLKTVDIIFKHGDLEIIDVEDLNDDDIVVNVSLVGAPSAAYQHIREKDYKFTVDLMSSLLSKELKGLTTNENGAATTINGWLQSVLTGLPVIDAPSNGRAHPTGEMGSLNLSEDKTYVSTQTYSGGKDEYHIEGYFKGGLHTTSKGVRDTSVLAGGMVAVCRNPVTVNYLKENAAIGGVSFAIELGKVYLNSKSPEEKIKNVVEHLQGSVVTSGTVSDYELKMEGGYDIGICNIIDHELTFFNEYMTLEKGEERVSTFPDLIMTFDTKTGLPVVSANLKEGMHITVISVPKENLILGSTMYNHNLLKQIESIIHKQIL
ncbi:DUF917 family protein [Phocicoccus pinnipedialis]|uniref:OsrF n=1 Tax=Phocicoccus pinnipedialis TaxID=110845 RepID=A0A6V7R4C4_9BACL|nr:DUF917 family protein [Jeotgalicoccus pinnipedialis]MBP1939657.1 DUF917 family protein [Jeotgalicoccus pinnipedialis]CAD2072279.1 hypothetical protein JEOPIN946_00377 [Jeotgalicoccus pinnipedialis]